MAKKLNLIGQVFGRLTVIEEGAGKTSISGRKRTTWVCQCSCGNTVETQTASLRGGKTKSCGCLAKEIKTTHGKSRTKENKVWRGIKQRCLNPKHKQYPDYGGRGITICDEWKDDFQAFYDCVGKAPYPSASLDRINNDGNYEPGNIRWASKSIQVINRRIGKDNKSGIKGVCFCNTHKIWKAYISVKSKSINLGHYSNKEDAVKARLVAEEKYHQPVLKKAS